jgi:hypothetical protein
MLFEAAACSCTVSSSQANTSFFQAFTVFFATPGARRRFLIELFAYHAAQPPGACVCSVARAKGIRAAPRRPELVDGSIQDWIHKVPQRPDTRAISPTLRRPLPSRTCTS